MTNIPTLVHRFFVKFLRVKKAIRLKCITYAVGLPPPPPPALSGLTLINAFSPTSQGVYSVANQVDVSQTTKRFDVRCVHGSGH